MTAEETLQLVSKQWCSLADLMRLEDQNYYVPTKAVPMQEVVKYLKIDIPYLESRINMKGV